MGGPNSDEGTESLVLYVYYNPFTVNIPILYKPVFTQKEPFPLPSLGVGHPPPPPPPPEAEHWNTGTLEQNDLKGTFYSVHFLPSS